MGRRSATDLELDPDDAATAKAAGKAEKAPKGRAARRRAHGPLAMWRFPVAVAGGVLISGPALLAAAQSDSSLLGSGRLDGVVLRGAGFGLVVWFATGIVDRILHAAKADDEPTDSPTDTARS
jgi:hypothetical protein